MPREIVNFTCRTEDELDRGNGGVVRPTAEQINFFTDMVGAEATAKLEELGGGLWVGFGLCDVPAKEAVSTKVYGEPKVTNKIQRSLAGYSYWSFVTFAEERVIFISLFKKRKDGWRHRKDPNKVVQIDFMFEDDWLNKKEEVGFSKQNESENIGGSGLYCNAFPFLRKLLGFTMAVSRDCQIQLSCEDARRARIYNRALGDRDNVVIYDYSRLLDRAY